MQISHYIKGIAMGAADIIPGISGGTIALITGIYARLIHALRHFDETFVRLIRGRHPRRAWRYIDGTFLVLVVAGIATSLLVFTGFILFLIHRFPIHTWSGFVGLILGSGVALIRTHSFTIQTTSLFTLGIIIGIVVGIIPVQSLPTGSWSIILSGIVASSAMILPGISGSYALVLLGTYEQMLQAFSSFEVGTLLLFVLGVVIGIGIMSRILVLVLTRHSASTLLILVGLMFGSLVRIWPWQPGLDTYTFISSIAIACIVFVLARIMTKPTPHISVTQETSNT